jgi:thiol-disulfide isomerase/thioredoxin
MRVASRSSWLRLGAAASWLLAAACDRGAADGDAAEAPSRSRVQAVLAEPGSATAPAGAGGGSAQVVVSAEPKKRARAPLCQGQLDDKPRAFRPARPPRQLAIGADDPLPENPINAGRRWTWVNFWAAWCVPCKEELPLLFTWQKQLSSQLDFAFISLDDDERQLREFLERQPQGGLDRTYWLPDGAVRAAWLGALGLATEPELPLQLLLDETGQLRCTINGAVEATDFDSLAAIVRN